MRIRNNSVVKGTILFVCLVVCGRTAGKKHRRSQDLKTACGYESCPTGKANFLNVHIISHTHNDVGWLKTVDQYYYGAKNDIANAGVQYILDSVVSALVENPARKFTYVESAFFWRWWLEQEESTQRQVQVLVNEGRLSFTNGAWSMNDEAATHYSSIIENFAWGLRKLNDSFGQCGRPSVGWQIDPFGHSRQHGSLLAQMGFDGLFLGRIDYQDDQKRSSEQSREMVWETSPSLGDPADLFTGVLPNTYSSPAGFCFDTLCADAPIMDDARLNDYNVEAKASLFIEEMTEQSVSYATSNLVVTMGGDFTYQNADMWFKNLDKLIKYVNNQQNNGSKINLFYSNPACYLYALNQAKVSWPKKDDDFFPYASDPHAYWTGYFTSRPAIKRYEREASAFLNACKQIDAMAGLDAAESPQVGEMRESLGVAQHHDAITGTEKQTVAFDYALRLDRGIKACQDVVAKGLTKIADLPPEADVKYCDLLNISQCGVMEDNNKVLLVIWNSLGREVQQYVHIPVPSGDYLVTGPKSEQLHCDVIPLAKSVYDIPGRSSNSTHELVFHVTLPPMNYATYGISLSTTENPSAKSCSEVMEGSPNGDDGDDDDVVLQNEYIAVNFDLSSGTLKSVTMLDTKDVIVVNQTFQYYDGSHGDNSRDVFRASGAYIFRPNCTGLVNTCRVAVTGGTYNVVQGTLVQEIRQYITPWISQIIRLYVKSRFLEFEWLVGPIPYSDGIGREIISVYASNLASNKSFFTDSNGREDIQRTRDFRPTFDVNLTEPISGNYYPVTSRIFIRDAAKGTQLTILTDRAEGGSSLVDGELELMVHRRLLHDDGFGVGEALNETAYGEGLVVRGKHHLLFSKIAEAASFHRLAAQERYWHPSFVFVPVEKIELHALQKFHDSKRKSLTDLPLNVHLLSMEKWTDGSILVRLEHAFQKDEDPVLSQPATVDLQGLFGKLEISSVQEVTLDGSALLSDIARLKWSKKSAASYHGRSRDFDGQNHNVTINPMQIRTFKIHLV